MADAFGAGQLVFYAHPEHSWVLGSITGAPDGKGLYPVKDKDNGGAQQSIAKDQIYPITNEGILTEEVDDLLMLSELHDSTLLQTIRRRYLEDLVYTYIGPIVIALNPFNYNIPWYKDDFMPNYLVEGHVIQKNKPHSWSVAHNTYYEMVDDNQDQSILVSGESGAGKTEAVKIVIKYLRGLMTRHSKDTAELEKLEECGKRILLASPILESFGNAKTGRNDNSSRFGKFLQIQFDSGGGMVGSYAIAYLLEKSRVLTAAQGERVYHAFYQLVKGKDASKFGLDPPQTYPSIMSGGVLDNASMEDAEGDDLSYRMTNEAYAICNVSVQAADAVWRVLAAILTLYRLTFTGDEAKGCTIDNDALVAKAAAFLMISPDELKTELLSTTQELRGEVITVLHSPAQCATIRNSFCMSMYNGAFLWLFDAINAGTSDSTNTAHFMGLLDIFGFEDFKVNSFEQMCINLANETLQNHYNAFIFEKDMQQCRDEGIDTATIDFVDNTITCELLTGKLGIFALLDEECALGKGSDMGFLEKVCNQHSKHPSFEKRTLWKDCFAIKHYAGVVKYNVEGVLYKNKDVLKDALKLLVRSSSDDVIKEVLPAPIDKRGRAPTVSGTFVTQIQSLMDMINSTNPHWIRCVKPHPAKKPRMLHGISTMSQMVNSGILETVRIRQLGYPVRVPLLRFMARFACIARGQSLECTTSDPSTACANILKGAKYTNAQGQIGKTMVFLKSQAYQDLEGIKRVVLHDKAVIAQQWARCISAQYVRRDKEYAKNKDIIEALRKRVQAFRALTGEEETARQALEDEHAKLFSVIRPQLEELMKDYFANRDKYLREAAERAFNAAVDELYGEYANVAEAVMVNEDRSWSTMIANADRMKRTAMQKQAQREAEARRAEQAALRKQEEKAREERMKAAAAAAEEAAKKRLARKQAAEEERAKKLREAAERRAAKAASVKLKREREQEELIVAAAVKEAHVRKAVEEKKKVVVEEAAAVASLIDMRHEQAAARRAESNAWSADKLRLLSYETTPDNRAAEILRASREARRDRTLATSHLNTLRVKKAAELTEQVERKLLADKERELLVAKKEAERRAEAAAQREAQARHSASLKVLTAQQREKRQQQAAERRQALEKLEAEKIAAKLAEDEVAANRRAAAAAARRAVRLANTTLADRGRLPSEIDEGMYLRLLGKERAAFDTIRAAKELKDAASPPPTRSIERTFRSATSPAQRGHGAM